MLLSHAFLINQNNLKVRNYKVVFPFITFFSKIYHYLFVISMPYDSVTQVRNLPIDINLRSYLRLYFQIYTSVL